MTLYDLDVSGNCYKVRLLAALAGIELNLVSVDLARGEHKQPPYIDTAPWGQVPFLEDGEVRLRDSQAILVYLARKYAGHQWWPDGAAQQGDVMQWLSTAANEIHAGPNAARLIDKFDAALDRPRALEISHQVLALLEQHLTQHAWLAIGRPTIAECAMYPYVALSEEGGISLAEYPAIQAWLMRVRHLPGYIGMPGVPDA